MKSAPEEEVRSREEWRGRLAQRSGAERSAVECREGTRLAQRSGTERSEGEELSAFGADAAGGDAGGGGPTNLAGPAEFFEEPDDSGAGIHLAAQDTVAGCGGVAVVEVVPGLAH